MTIVQGIDVIAIGVQDLSKRMYVIMQQMINKFVWHGRATNDQWVYVQDCVAEVYQILTLIQIILQNILILSVIMLKM